MSCHCTDTRKRIQYKLEVLQVNYCTYKNGFLLYIMTVTHYTITFTYKCSLFNTKTLTNTTLFFLQNLETKTMFISISFNFNEFSSKTITI